MRERAMPQANSEKPSFRNNPANLSPVIGDWREKLHESVIHISCAVNRKLLSHSRICHTYTMKNIEMLHQDRVRTVRKVSNSETGAERCP